jgi:hypothetical protein
MEFDARGPFDVCRSLVADCRSAFWRKVEAREGNEGLSTALGCYVFCLGRGGETRPWYVGQAMGREGFKQEVFAQHKISHYLDLLEVKPRHQPSLVLFPLITAGYGGFSYARAGARRVVDWLEIRLIAMALVRNPELRNTANTRLYRGVHVHGLLGPQYSGRPSREAEDVRAIFLPVSSS